MRYFFFLGVVNKIKCLQRVMNHASQILLEEQMSKRREMGGSSRGMGGSNRWIVRAKIRRIK